MVTSVLWVSHLRFDENFQILLEANVGRLSYCKPAFCLCVCDDWQHNAFKLSCRREETFIWAVWFMLLLLMHACQEWQFKRCRIAGEFRIVAMFVMKSSHHKLLDIERSSKSSNSAIVFRHWCQILDLQPKLKFEELLPRTGQ